MNTKNFTVHFHQLECYTIPQPNRENHLWGLFVTEHNRQNSGHQPIIGRSPSGYSFELKELNVHQSVVTGCLALLRDDGPHIRDVSGNTHAIPTNPGDRFIEKNYFLYFRDKRLLVWQFNLAANHVNNLGIVLTSISGSSHTVICNAMIDEAFGFDPNVSEIQYVDLRIRQPQTVAEKEEVSQLDQNDWGVHVFEAMTATNSRSMSVVLATRGQDRRLSRKAAKMVKDLWGCSQTRKLRVKVSDVEEPIDLLAKRIKRRIAVDMDGLYPNSKSVLEKLQQAKDDCDAELQRNL